MTRRPLLRRLALVAAAAALPLVLVACGSSSSPHLAVPTVAAARTFRLAGFQPTGPVTPGRTVPVTFAIDQPSGKPLTQFKTGSGPHTGIHLIIIRSDLGQIVHRHPPIAADGRLSEPVTFTVPGRYRVIVDVYPAASVGTLPNFQLFESITVAGKAVPRPLPPPGASVATQGYRFTIVGGPPALKAIQPAFLTLHVVDKAGRPVTFTPWFGALAHAIFIHKGSLDYFHTHVCSAGASGCTSTLGGARVAGTSTTPGQLKVGVLLPEPGTWRLFLQTQVNGKVLTAPFTLEVK